MVIWAETQEKARRFAEKSRVGTGGIVFAGNRSFRSIEGLRATSVIEVDGARHLPDGAEMLRVLRDTTRKMSKPVPWLQIGQLVVET